ncbi:uncharacterized protein DNG_10040 [Cephalotrichum gorgonifer]|uniref:NACHT domain-containing protein n=1 Tax=Cephalotrichum gorgonifer TaxID=2041049 RepID=A0AAE8N6V2_9PEZI|nr:uncharacterized protein DNG_10040 [Cephalotrichum gorgonifer]
MEKFDASQEAFEAAKNAFRKRLKDEALFKEILEASSIDKVWEVANKVQATQHAQKRLRNMAKIKEFLDKMSGYTSVMDTFVQAKPEIMALIWGPIRLVLLWTASIAKFADAITSAMAKIGDSLPQFLEAAKIFHDATKLKDVLALFYKDIIDFHIITLEFFGLSRSRIFFESIWPRQREKIDVVASNIERHTSLLRNEVTLQHIREEHDARTKSLAHFDEETKVQELQKFQSLKFSISPRNYDRKLDELLNRTCKNSTKWLMRDKSFMQWLDMGDPETRTLWMQGIPGAGKTFLAAAAVEEARERHQTLFAFASHVDKDNTTARSVLQSLVFQLAFESEDIRSFLVQSNERALSSSTAYVATQLKILLGTTGPTYIVLDGLDEMDKVERGFLLQHLLDTHDCPDTRILVSSRSEDDITNFLKTTAVAIRVDKRNGGSILSYIDQRTQDWMKEKGFKSKPRQQIRQLLTPLAANANGMFLYARIVMDNAQLFTDLDEIKRELEVLPVDLNDAYHRIFKRINESHPALRQKVRAILGWIGCAPTPMTRREMEQALLVTSGDTAAPSVTSDLNLVSICGPIVEVVDEIPQFVHFTVKEYVFSQQIGNFIDTSEANYSLAKSSLTYLCSGIFDVNQSDTELSKNMLTGKYRLHSYATSQWIELTRRCIEHSKDLSAYPDLLALLFRLSLELRNYSFKNQVNLKDPAFEGIGSEHLEISQIVCGVLQFRQDERQTDWNFHNGFSWLNEDPTVLSDLSIRLHRNMKLLMEDLEILIFELTKAEDVDKLQQTVLYADGHIGYVPTYNACCLAAKMGSLPMVEILSLFNGYSWLEHWERGLFYGALFAGESRDLLRLVLDKLRDTKRSPAGYGILAREAFATSSPEMYAEWEAFLLDSSRRLAGAAGDYRDGGAESDSDGAFYHAMQRIPQYNKRHPLFSTIAFNASRKGAVFETRLVQTWHRLIEVIGPLDPRFLGWSLTCLARSSNPSIPLATELLRLGAPIDFPRGKYAVSSTWRTRNEGASKVKSRRRSSNSQPPPQDPNEPRRRRHKRRRHKRHRGMTALHLVSRATSERAAMLARFLLERGADPEYGFAGVKPAQERGAVLMQKWLKESWDEVVKRTNQARAEKTAAQGGGEPCDRGNENEDDEEERCEARRRRKLARRARVGQSDDEMNVGLDE